MATATAAVKKKPIVKKSAPHPTVADYIVRRLAREGITECFGVAGDFAFKLNDAVARSERIRWIGCSNELDAAYAADGYARMRGCSMLMTTYAVGELSAFNGVMGAKAERSCVFHLVGMPTCATSGSARSSTTRSATGYSRTSRTSQRRRRAFQRLSLPTTAHTKWSG